ncbi:MAG: glycosyltransferase family 1 protein [Acidobacteriaceae bacterium]|nr:glycosyltransferase family 1 protein [Acidobacteriaceae bacterium]
MSEARTHRGILLNASRVTSVGGLHAYTDAILRCLSASGEVTAALVAPQMQLPPNVTRLEAPASITMRGASSWLRSLRGYFYAVRQSRRYADWHVLSTTHLGLQGHRRQVLTVHDLRPRFLPDSWVQGVYFRFLLPRILRKADGVLTVSEASKEMIAATYGISRGKIFVVPNVVRAVKPAVVIVPEAPYLLMVNAMYRHKNATELLEQHALWRPRYRLKILTGEGRLREELRAQVKSLGLAAHVDFLPVVSDEELATLYTHAAALVYPSRMEGFGLPPAEAMLYGTPVIVSDIPVFHEILGDVPLFVQLGDRASWQRALEGIEDARSAERVERGKRIAEQYSEARMCTALTAALRAIWPNR